jgi:hypothetical protein
MYDAWLSAALDENRWRRVNVSYLVALVRARVKFLNGQAEEFQPEKPDEGLTSSQALLIFAAIQAPSHVIFGMSHLSVRFHGGHLGRVL